MVTLNGPCVVTLVTGSADAEIAAVHDLFPVWVDYCLSVIDGGGGYVREERGERWEMGGCREEG